jgi:hypothetical protein
LKELNTGNVKELIVQTEFNMKKTFTSLKRRWKAETPKLVVFLQSLSLIIAGIPAYYKDLPDEFRASVPKNAIWYIVLSGIIITSLLQFITPKRKTK